MILKPQEEKFIEDVFSPDVFGMTYDKLIEDFDNAKKFCNSKDSIVFENVCNRSVYEMLLSGLKQLNSCEYLELLTILFDRYNVNSKRKQVTTLAIKRYKEYLVNNYRDEQSQKIISRMMAFGKFLRQMREIKGVTVTQLADRTNLSRTEIYRLENGERLNPSAPTLKAIALALNTPLSEFLIAGGFEIEMPTESKPTIAAHLQGSEDLTEDELGEVKKYIEFLKARRTM
jgi:transcriptional regulator with XRE-family HTH domain